MNHEPWTSIVRLMGVRKAANAIHFLKGTTVSADKAGIRIIMGFDCSISMEGLRAAENQLNQAAKKVSRPVNNSDVAASAGEATDRLTLTSNIDIAGAMVEAAEAKIIYKANLKMIETQMELEEEALDLFG